MDGFELQISLKDPADNAGLCVIYPQASGASLRQIIAKWRAAAHPHALLFGRGNLVTDPLSGNLAFELGKGEQHIERQPSHAGGGIEGLRDAHKTDVMLLEQLDHTGKIRERAGQAIDLVDNHDIDASRGDIGEQLLKAG